MKPNKIAMKWGRHDWRALCMMVAASATITYSAWGATRTWTGGGDGLKWSDPLNWDVNNNNVKYNDEIVFNSGDSGNPLVTSNDLGTAGSWNAFGKIVCTGKGKVILSGNPLRTQGLNKIVFTNDCPVTCALDILIPSPDFLQAQWHCANVVEWTGSITKSSGGGWIELFTYVDDCVFSGDITCPEAQIRANTKKRIYFDGRLVASQFNTLDGAVYDGSVYYRHPSNEVANVGISYLNVFAEAENAFGTNAVVTQGWRADNGSKLEISADQVINRLAISNWAAQNDLQHRVRGARSSMLTMKATADCVCDSRFEEALTLVWDPQGDYDFTAVTNHTHTINGGIVVKRGTFSVVGTSTTMSNLTFVAVSNDAAFVMDVSQGMPLRSLASIDLGERARFEYGANVRTPHPDKYPVFRLASEAKIVMPAGVAVSGCVYRNGAFLPVKTYTGRENPDPGDAEPVDWIQGSGTFTTANDAYYTYWVGGNGLWNDATKWSGTAVPAANKSVRVWDRGDMTLTCSGNAGTIGSLECKNFAGGLTEVCISTEVGKTGGLTLLGGVKLSVADGGILNLSSQNVTVRNGAWLAVEGGALNFQNFANTFTLGYLYGDPKDTGLKVSSGTVNFTGTGGGAFTVDKYGRIEMTGGTMSVTGVPVQIRNATCAISLSNKARMNLESLSTVAGSTLEFKVGASDTPRLAVAETLTVASGTVLKIDATEWMAAGRGRGRKLLTWGSLSGTFDEIVVEPAAAAKHIYFDSKGVWMGSSGFIVLFR